MVQPQICIFDHLDKRGESLAQLYEDRLAFAAAAEAVGFQAYYVAEHHSTPLGHAPSPSVYIAALSQRTRTMRIGSMVHVLPAYEPLRLAEEICMLDHLSGGRLDIGVGRGASPYEVGFFGIVPQQARDVFEEALDVIQQVMNSDTLSHRGHFFRYYDVPLTMRPLQAGGPPLWYGAFSERNLVFAAQHGLNITLNGPPQRLRQLATRYREVWAQHHPSRAMPQVASMYQLFVGATDAEAEAIASDAYQSWYGGMTHIWRANNSMPRETLPANFGAAAKLGSFIAGSAETVRAKLQAILDASGLERLLLQCNLGTMDQNAVLDSIGRFGADVLPYLSVAGTAEPQRQAA